jgi:hypothetical protein
MNYTELEDARLEIEYFDNPDYNYDDNEDEILDLSVELSLEDEEGDNLWDGFIDQYSEEFEKSFCHYDESSKPSKPVYVEYDSQEDLIQEILKYADKFAKVALEQNDSLPAYNVFVSVNEWGTGEQYSADDAIEVIEE